MSARPSQPFVELRVAATSAERAEIAAAEVWEAGAEGVVEEDEAPSFGLTIYAPLARRGDVETALREALGGDIDIAVRPVEAIAWEEAWKEGFAAIEISPRLVVRPSFVPAVPGVGAELRELIVEPGQAFGTGSHLSTRLALEAIDAQYSPLGPGPSRQSTGRPRAADRVLDVGTGSGILAVAALLLGAQQAVGFDLDPLAAPAALECARANALGANFCCFTGPIDALAPTTPGFDLVAVNLLRSEMLPIAGPIAARAAAGGVLVLSGLLAGDTDAVLRAFAALGWAETARWVGADADAEAWVALTLARS
jgi:ribosomal protein L11 methylase PrmA